MTAHASDGSATLRVGNLETNAAKGRYGVAYVRSICSQAHVGFAETSPDEDALAVDGDIKFAEASVKVQIKCTGRFRIRGRSLSWPIESGWIEKWNKSRVPTYFILVVIDSDHHAHWIAHSASGTLHKSAAYWLRVDGLAGISRIRIPKGNRFTVDAIPEWHRQLLACFQPGVVA